MKILFVQPYVTFEGVISDTLPGQLAKRGHDVDVVSYIRQKGNPKKVSKGTVTFHSINAFSVSIPAFVKEFPYFLSLKSKIAQINPDLIHINNLAFLTTLQAAQIAKSLGKKSILHVHGVVGERGTLFNSVQWAYILTFGNSVFNKTDKVICLTNKDCQKVTKHGCSLQKIRIIANGVDVNKFQPSTHEIPNSLLWCGRFVPQKGLNYLIEAMRIIVKEKGKTDVKLIMTGDGPLRSNIVQLVQDNGLTKNIMFAGLLPRDELPDLISTTSLHVLPSLNEGMPYVLLEAMACGKAVIGSDISGISDVITHGKTGFLVPPKDPVALANGILYLLTNPEVRAEIGSNARKLMLKQYSWDAIVRKVEDVYNETLVD